MPALSGPRPRRRCTQGAPATSDSPSTGRSVDCPIDRVDGGTFLSSAAPTPKASIPLPATRLHSLRCSRRRHRRMTRRRPWPLLRPPPVPPMAGPSAPAPCARAPRGGRRGCRHARPRTHARWRRPRPRARTARRRRRRARRRPATADARQRQPPASQGGNGRWGPRGGRAAGHPAGARGGGTCAPTDGGVRKGRADVSPLLLVSGRRGRCALLANPAPLRRCFPLRPGAATPGSRRWFPADNRACARGGGEGRPCAKTAAAWGGAVGGSGGGGGRAAARWRRAEVVVVAWRREAGWVARTPVFPPPGHPLVVYCMTAIDRSAVSASGRSSGARFRRPRRWAGGQAQGGHTRPHRGLGGLHQGHTAYRGPRGPVTRQAARKRDAV